MTKVVVVSYLAQAPFAPRGIRTREVVKAMRRRWEVELICGPAPAAQAVKNRTTAGVSRRLASRISSATLIDRFEPWTWRHLAAWTPRADAGLLVGFPFSTLAWGAKRLAAQGIPYVADLGDPWFLTVREAHVRGLAAARSRRVETRLWQSAAGAIVTTRGQAEDLRAIFPGLRILVRPNGYAAACGGGAVHGATAEPGEVLRLAHFGTLSGQRISVVPFLTALARCGLWRGIDFHQFGADWGGMLAGLPESVSIRIEASRPWNEIAGQARRFDAVVVVGNRDPRQLPSKVVDYLVLPVPRIAVTAHPRNDSIIEYLADKPGWLVVADGDPATGRLVAGHVDAFRNRAPAAPVSESWPRVADTVVGFFSSAAGIAT